MPKILYFVTEDWFFLSHFMPMARAAYECGFEVVVATRAGEAAKKLAAERLVVVPLKTGRGALGALGSFRDVLRLFRVIKQQRPDVIHCIALQSVIIGGIAAKLARVPAIVLAPTGLGHLWLEQGPAASILRLIIRTLVGTWLRGPRTYFLFENLDDPLEFHLRVDEVTIVGGAGVDPAPVVPSLPDAGPMKVAVVSRMIAPKGIEESVQAVRFARRAGCPVELHLFGLPDPANPRSISEVSLRAWAQEPGIFWHGHVTDVLQIWREHHVAMLLSYREGLPRALVEAAAAGKPIVTTDVPGCRELVRHGCEGILVPAGDGIAAGRALVCLVGDPALRDRLGAAALSRFRERFTTEAVKRTVSALYKSLLRGSRTQTL